MPPSDLASIRRAGMLHDLGRCGVHNGILDKAGPLSETEWERVRLHPYLTGRLLSRWGALARLAAIAAAHHERTDGTGYFRGVHAAELSPAMPLLAAVDAYHAMT
jgi:HD-GYP domain-containing protein (c-di-GMP phosphodiesterase class II)